MGAGHPFSFDCFYIKDFVYEARLTENPRQIHYEKGQIINGELEYKCRALEDFNNKHRVRQGCLVPLTLKVIDVIDKRLRNERA